jgi:hypothetical protein
VASEFPLPLGKSGEISENFGFSQLTTAMIERTVLVPSLFTPIFYAE